VHAVVKTKTMKKLTILSLSLLIILAIGCKTKTTTQGITLSPEMGAVYNQGKPVSVKLNYPDDVKPDSIVYLLDSVRFATAKDSAAITVKTDSLKLGSRVITAKLYQGGKSQDVSTNFMVYAAKAPQALKFTVEKTFPHDTASYTEGLEYLDGILYESDGGRAGDETGRSSLRTASLETGKVIKKIDGDPTVFLEGIAVVGNKIVQLTYTEKKGFVYDKSTLKLLSTFENNVGLEGWGMCYDGTKLYMDDSTNRIWFLDPNNYHDIGHVDVYDDKGPIMKLNELEMIDGKLYANIYETDTIVVIDPKTGAVLQSADMSALYPQATRVKPAEVMNGIAWDAKGKRLFVTGKKWQHL
jgi:glutamine cyclotransferase